MHLIFLHPNLLFYLTSYSSIDLTKSHSGVALLLIVSVSRLARQCHVQTLVERVLSQLLLYGAFDKPKGLDLTLYAKVLRFFRNAFLDKPNYHFIHSFNLTIFLRVIWCRGYQIKSCLRCKFFHLTSNKY